MNVHLKFGKILYLNCIGLFEFRIYHLWIQPPVWSNYNWSLADEKENELMEEDTSNHYEKN